MTGGAQGPGKQGPLPAMQVVGFHVEGTSPSPIQTSLLGDTRPVGTGSPTPVIIPPSFQGGIAREPGVSREASFSRTSADPSKTLDAPSATGASSVAGLPVPNAAGARGVMSEAPAAQAGPNSSIPLLATSSPKPIQNAGWAEAAHAGLHRPIVEGESSPTATSDASSLSTTNISEAMSAMGPRPGHTAPLLASPKSHSHHHHHHGHQQQKPQQPAQAAAAGKAKAAAPAAQQQAAGKGKNIPDQAAIEAAKAAKAQMTRAERRAIQEAQRAAKAAGKGGDDAPKPKAPAAAGAAAGKGAGLGADAAGKQAEKPAAGAGGQVSKGPSSVAGASRIAVGSEGGAAARSNSAAEALPPTPGASAAGPGGVSQSASMQRKQSTRGVVSLNSTELFAHLQQYRKVTVSTLLTHKETRTIHPAVLQLGLRYADGTISGANARCVAMLHAFSQVIQDYTTPEGKSLSRDLQQLLNSIINFLIECRPLSMSMGNAIKYLKLKISKIDPSTPESEAKAFLIATIQDFVHSRITVADGLLVKCATDKVDAAGDVILTYAYSTVVASTLTAAAQQGKKFRVIVLDSRPELEGRRMLQVLLRAGVPCTYAHLSAVSYSIREVTKVFLGAAGVLSNGTVISRAGAAAVAMVAHANAKPVMICCESYKFHERVQLDSITHNELGDPEALVDVPGRPELSGLQAWRESPRLGLLNLKYDAMPADYVTMIITEFGMMPPTSVPVILREQRNQETAL